MDKKYLVEVFNHLLGYGDITSKLVFFGIEENGSIDEKSIAYDYNKTFKNACGKLQYYINKYEKVKRTKVKNESAFYSMHSGLEGDFKAYYETYENKFEIDLENSNKSILYKYCRAIEKKFPYENSLYSNLYPFWKKTTNNNKYDKITAELFGLNSFDEWYQDNFKERENLLLLYLQNLLRSKSEIKIFSFGAHKSFIALFNKFAGTNIFNAEKPETFNAKGRNQKYWKEIYKNTTIIILYHPSNNWLNNEQLKELLTKF